MPEGATPVSKVPDPPQGILFRGVRFSEPSPFFLAVQNLPATAGLYAILVPDFSWEPRSFRPIFFGEADDLAMRIGYLHKRYGDWCRAAAGSNLYVAICEMPGASEEERRAATAELMQVFHPACNEGGSESCRDALYEEVSRIASGTVTMASLLAAARNGERK